MITVKYPTSDATLKVWVINPITVDVASMYSLESCNIIVYKCCGLNGDHTKSEKYKIKI